MENIDRLIHHIYSVRDTVDDIDSFEKIGKAAHMIFEAWKDKKRVYTFGNGGSASTAEHFASGLLKELGVRAICLNSLPLNTALANDEGYDEIFRCQLETLLWVEDVVVAISYSGNSDNIVLGLSAASRPVLTVNRILLSGPKLYPYQVSAVDVHIRVKTDDIMVAEDLHLAICHSIEKQVAALIQEHNDPMHENRPVVS